MADLGAFFDDGDEDNGMLLTAAQRRPTSLAEETDTPPKGATCYLNSLLQALFMTPEFREAIFRLELCVSATQITSPEDKSDLIESESKRNVLFNLQQLFVYLQALDENAQSTKPLTDSFMWSHEDVIVQHDAQELNRVLFDVIEQALVSTPHFSLIRSLYKGVFAYQTECLECKNITESLQDFGDLSVNVKGMASLQAAIEDMCKAEILTGGNQYFCEVCGRKVDAQRRTALKALPPILMFALNRFEYVPEADERKKITTSFSFPLELDLREFVPDATNTYELFGVLIHRGTAYHGHYHVYLRDVTREGLWTPQEQMQMTDAETAASEVRFADEAEREPIGEKAPLDDTWVDPNRRKKRRKRLRKGGRKQEKPRNNKGQKAESRTLQPMVAKNEELLYGWFDFDDSVVTAISADQLSAQFGGSSETAYILIYRKASLQHIEQPMIPLYWAERISQMNSDLTERRGKYEELKRQVTIMMQPLSLFVVRCRQVEDGLVRYIAETVPYTAQGEKVTMCVEETVGQLKRVVAECVQADQDVELVEVMRLSHGYVHLLRTFDSVSDEDTLEKASVKHLSCIVVLPRDSAHPAWKLVGQDCEPIVVNVRVGKADFQVPVNKSWTLADARKAIARKLGRGEDSVTLNVHGQKAQLEMLASWDSHLSDLKWYHLMSLICLEPATAATAAVPAAPPTAVTSAPETTSAQVSVLVYDEADQETVVQHFVPLKWKLAKLVTDLKKLFNVDVPVECRVKKLAENQYFSQEHLLKRLSELGFAEGGLRICFERGPAPKAGEIVLKVGFGDAEFDLFVPANATVGQM